jgi:SAM-dependent methyltransferase
MEQSQGRSAASETSEGGQIKSRERVRDLAEVYTHQREVNAMLDLVPDMFPSEEHPGNTDRTFLEPACGSGNFLVEILARKLAYVTPRRYGRSESFEHCVLRCLASIYGIDICQENVAIARERMSEVIHAHTERHLGSKTPTPAFVSAVKTILATNIIRADSIADAANIELVEYASASDGTFIREWSHPLDPAADEPTLFSVAGPRRDAVPIHYSELAYQPGPAAAEVVDQQAA